MRILFVCRNLPHAGARDSGRLDTYHYIKALSERHEISLIAFVPAEERPAVATLETLCERIVTVPYRPHALGPRLWRAWWRLWLPKVYGRVFSLRYRSALRRMALSTRYNVAVVDGMMAGYGRSLGKTPRILDEVDVYATVAFHLYQNTTHPLWRLWLMFDWLRTTYAELRYAAAYDGVFVRSGKDKIILRDFLPRQRISILPPWFEGLGELQNIPIERPSGNNILFVGAMNIPANVEAVIFFVRRVLPLIRKRLPDVHFYIVGGNPLPQVEELSLRDGVTVTGAVERLTPYYEKCAVNVVPLFTGGGIIVKTLNGMSSGRPTVTTEIGNSGTGAQNERDLLVASPQPEPFATAVYQLLVDEGRWRRFAVAGRQFVQKTYAWSTTTTKLNAFLGQIAQNTT